MERDYSSYYSENSSNSRISYISNINNYIHDTNNINRANLINMIRIMREDQQEESELSDDLNYDDVENNEESNSIDSYEIYDELSLLSNHKEKETTNFPIDFFTEERNSLYLNNHGRAITAPTKHLNDSSEFKRSLNYINLEKAVIFSNRLIIEPTESGEKFDVDSDEGIFICKKFLEQVEKLMKVIL